MPQSIPDTIEVPPLPPLRWSEFAWEGGIVLPAWAGFQSRGGSYASRNSTRRSAGRVDVSVAKGRGGTPPTAAQAAAFGWLLENQFDLRGTLLDALLARYQQWREPYGADADDWMAEVMPPVATPDGFRDLIGPSIVHVLTVEHDGVAYVGLEFGCDWDEEHALGFLTHRGRVVEVGAADTSFDERRARADVP